MGQSTSRKDDQMLCFGVRDSRYRNTLIQSD